MYQENKPQYRILLLIALAHGLNDLIQGVIPSIYPTLQSKYALTMTQVGGNYTLLPTFSLYITTLSRQLHR